MANLCSMTANQVGSYGNLIAPEGAESEMDKGVSVNSVGNNDTVGREPSQPAIQPFSACVPIE
jgi:hypothetical protein